MHGQQNIERQVSVFPHYVLQFLPHTGKTTDRRKPELVMLGYEKTLNVGENKLVPWLWCRKELHQIILV